MTTEQQPPSQQQQQQEAAANEVGTKVAGMREAVLAGAGAALKAGPTASTAAAGGSSAAAGGAPKNMAGVFARQMMKSSWIAQTDGQLLTDILPVLEGGCIYLPGFLCEPEDFQLLQALTRDLQAHAERTGAGMINWSQHLKYENPDWSPTFRTILRRLEDHFDVEILATRLNFYADATMWKPYHHDSHAYGANGKKEDFTMGASFGATRELAFKHVASGQIFSFPQGNGDVFAFTSEVNSKFQHGVPRVKGNPERTGPRFSIIAWGRRRSLTERNSSETARLEQQPLRGGPSPSLSEREAGVTGNPHGAHKPHKHKGGKPSSSPAAADEAEAEAVALPEVEKDDARPAPIDMKEVVQLVERLVLQEAAKKQKQPPPPPAAKGGGTTKATAAAEGDKAKAAGGRRRGRVQHSWAS